jgi:mannose/fructose/N-acetylgalactosamine-specific phosphotransferase system component IID
MAKKNKYVEFGSRKTANGLQTSLYRGKRKSMNYEKFNNQGFTSSMSSNSIKRVIDNKDKEITELFTKFFLSSKES